MRGLFEALLLKAGSRQWHHAPGSKKGRQRRWSGQRWEYRDAPHAKTTGTRKKVVRLGASILPKVEQSPGEAPSPSRNEFHKQVAAELGKLPVGTVLLSQPDQRHVEAGSTSRVPTLVTILTGWRVEVASTAAVRPGVDRPYNVSVDSFVNNLYDSAVRQNVQRTLHPAIGATAKDVLRALARREYGTRFTAAPEGSDAEVAQKLERKAAETSPPGVVAEDLWLLSKDTMHPRFAEVMESVTLWTNGNVASVRDPEKYEPELAEPVLGVGSYSTEKASKAMYVKANKLLADMAATPNTSPPEHVYRGMGLPSTVLAELTVGAVFDFGSVASFSEYEDVAESFLYRTGGGEGVLMGVASPTRGMSVAGLSIHAEDEFVLGGLARVVSVSPTRQPVEITLELV